MKYCYKCKLVQNENKFSKNKSKSDGLQDECKNCRYLVSNSKKKRKNSKCFICLQKINYLSKTTHYDHDHKTGEFRGLLCNACNHGVGFFKDNVINLTRAISYLNRRIL
jgi:hypothetical protein